MEVMNISGQQVLRFADIEILRYQVEGFEALPLERKLFIYHLAQATLAGRDILWDQHGQYGLRIRHILEAVLVHGRPSGDERKAFETYLYRVWFSSGVHHHYGNEKFVPEFTEAWLRAEIASLQAEQCLLLEYDERELAEVLAEIFDPKRSSRRTVQSGQGDLVKASSVNFYDPSLSQSEVEAFYQGMEQEASPEERRAPLSYGLNSRLAVDGDGKPYEQCYNTKGLYREALQTICQHLRDALPYAETDGQREALKHLISSYEGGGLKAYNEFCIAWVADVVSTVDFINGFTETYSDPLGLRGSWEGLVHIRNERASERTRLISQHAKWFEDHAPIDARFKKDNPQGVSASVVTVAMLGGDSYPATPIGVNLPNADWIRAEYGSKSVTIENIHAAYREASRHSGMDEAFVPDEAVRALLARYDGLTDELHTDLHECLGHGSGKLLEGVSPDALGAYGSTIEEARADLFALYYMADAKLLELGLLPDAEAYKACYYRYLLNGLVTQLVRIKQGDQIEEAHMRNRALIARYALERGAQSGAVELRGLELIIRDYEALRSYFAELLAEIQRIKSEGDKATAGQLVEQYAIAIDPELHREVLARYARLNLAPYRGFINPEYTLVEQEGKVVDVAVSYTAGYAEQMLSYSQQYGYLPLAPTDEALWLDPHPSQETLQVAKGVREGLRTAMDGEVAGLMRRQGLHYDINFGITLGHLKQKVEGLTPSLELASYFWSRSVRELKLMALFLLPIEEANFTILTAMAQSCCHNHELRDALCMHLADRLPDAPQWALAWLKSDQHKAIHAVAFTILARHLAQGYQLKHEAHACLLLERAFEVLSDTTEGYITPTIKSALLVLKRWLWVSSELAERLSVDPRLVAWAEGDNPLQREFATDLRFELTYRAETLQEHQSQSPQP